MKRLGQLLLDRGWITPDQLSRALAQQRLVGGRLGTCLLETHAIEERQLLRGLSEQLHVPFADVEDLRAVPRETLALLPAKVARRCRAIPFHALGGQLSLAVLNTKDLALQDELAFVTGKRLKVHVAQEARLFEALERYFGEECPRRFAQLVDRLNRARFLWQQEEERPTEPSTPTPAVPSWSLGALTAAAPALPPPLPTPEAPAEMAAPAPGAAAPPAAPAEGLREGARLAPTTPEPPDRDAIGRALVARLSAEFHRVVLLAVRGQRLSGWVGSGSDLSHGALAELSLEPEETSILATVRDRAPLFRGPLPSLPSHHALAAVWGGRLPRDCALLALPVGGRTAALVYLDREPDELGTLDPGALRDLLAETGEQLALRIRRRKADTQRVSGR